MYYEVYIDVLFLINLILDMILLIGTAKFLKKKPEILRIFVAAILGALWTCIISIYPMKNTLLESIITYIGISLLMVIIAYKEWGKNLVKSVITLYLTTFLIGGIINFLYYYTKAGYYLRTILSVGSYKNINISTFIIFSIVTFFGIHIVVRFIKYFKNIEKTLYNIELTINKQVIKATGLLDTGNSLIEPISGKPVIIAEYSLIEDMLPSGMKTLIQVYLESGTINYDNLEDEYASKIKLIPYHSIGQKNGILIGMIIERLTINQGDNIICREHIPMGIHGKKLSSKNEYNIILHPDLM